MAEDKQPRLDLWDDFAGEFLKADLIKTFPVVLVCVKISTEAKDGKNHLYIHVEYNGKEWLIELNKTNQNFLRSKGITSPKNVIGKKLTFEKIKVNNPTTHAPMDSLLITAIA